MNEVHFIHKQIGSNLGIWFQEEIELVPGDRFVTEYHEDGRCVLTIKDITFDDEAEYTCQAKNEAGVSTTFVDIFVESKNKMVMFFFQVGVISVYLHKIIKYF